MTNDDILGDSIPMDQQEMMRQFCYQSLKLGVGVGAYNSYIFFIYLCTHLH